MPSTGSVPHTLPRLWHSEICVGPVPILKAGQRAPILSSNSAGGLNRSSPYRPKPHSLLQRFSTMAPFLGASSSLACATRFP